jgi:hypothetical protein
MCNYLLYGFISNSTSDYVFVRFQFRSSPGPSMFLCVCVCAQCFHFTCYFPLFFVLVYFFFPCLLWFLFASTLVNFLWRLVAMAKILSLSVAFSFSVRVSVFSVRLSVFSLARSDLHTVDRIGRGGRWKVGTLSSLLPVVSFTHTRTHTYTNTHTHTYTHKHTHVHPPPQRIVPT